MFVKCPICEKPTTWKDNPYRPFCSERCKIIDLGNWASEDYHISSPLKDASEETEQQQD
ncbi:MAG: DNA gyrase inhibitor YacG [Blastocatellia bacterium]